MFVTSLAADALGTNCWVLAAAEGEACVVVDPGYGVARRLAEVLTAHRLRPAAVVLTHGHVDHTYDAPEICRIHGIPAYLHPADRWQLTDPWGGLGLPSGQPVFGTLTAVVPADVRDLIDGQVLSVADLAIEVWHAPGHSQGSVVLRLGTPELPVALTGDVLFAGSIGRMDLPGGDEAAMSKSLRRVLLPMDHATIVHPGHGPSTTIGAERTGNPYLQGLS